VQSVDAIDYLSDVEPAPGGLALVERFVNTVDREHGREMLYDAPRLAELFVSLGLLDARTRVTARHLAAAHALREQLRALALANNGVPTDVVLTAAPQVRVSADGAELARARDVDGAFASLIGIAYTAMADGTWARLKSCRRDVCGWLFYDRSRNRSAVWCDMAVCGNRTKTKAYRARRAGGKPPVRTGRR
jgi:predicted RNA-binding Zn ribbon-like protein